jgi:precorrin-2 dehydrogenase / sirohydrochlorin ferrochelatase
MAAPSYPVSLSVEGRDCLVVGGGQVAARKARELARCGALVQVVAPSVAPELMRQAGVRIDERSYRKEDVGGRWLVVAATDDRAVNRAVAADAEAAGVWVNAVDDPEVCSFTAPALLRQGPVVVAVSTGGRSPAMAGWLRDRLAEQVGPEMGVVAELLAEARAALRAKGRSTTGVDWRRVLDSDMLELVRAGKTERARERLAQCLSSS